MDNGTSGVARFTSAKPDFKTPSETAPKFIEHKVQKGDELTLLSVRYNVPNALLRRYNPKAQLGEHLDHMIGETFFIPLVPELNIAPTQEDEATKKRRAQFYIRKAFRTAIVCSDEEAELYLTEHNWDLETAVKAWRDDSSWEDSSDAKSIRKSQQQQQGMAVPGQGLRVAITQKPGTSATSGSGAQPRKASSNSSFQTQPQPSAPALELTDRELEAHLQANSVRRRKSYGQGTPLSSGSNTSNTVEGETEGVELRRLIPNATRAD